MKKIAGLFLVFVSFFVTSLFFTEITFAIDCHPVEGQSIDERCVRTAEELTTTVEVKEEIIGSSLLLEVVAVVFGFFFGASLTAVVPMAVYFLMMKPSKEAKKKIKVGFVVNFTVMVSAFLLYKIFGFFL